MNRILLVVLAAAPCFAAIDGTVTNATKNVPQPNVLVSLMQPGRGGMQTVATTKSGADGKFHFDQDPQGPRIIQAIYAGVIYTQVAPPNTPADNLSVQVFDPTKDPASVRLAQHIVIFQPGETELNVSENYIFQNTTKLSFNDPENGSARVFIPEAGRDNAKTTITSPGGLPITRELGKTREAGVFKIDYPLKPGETRFDVSYRIPTVKPMLFSGRVVKGAEPVRLIVPNGVTLTGGNLQLLGQEPTTQASIYTVTGDKYDVEVAGMGDIRPPQGNGEDNGAPQIHAGRPRVYDQIWVVVTLTLLILAVGAFILYRRGAPVLEKK